MQRAADRGRTLRLLAPLLRDALDQLAIGFSKQALTLVGIVWGAAAVVLLLSLGSGFRAFLDLGFARTGDRWVLVDNQYTSVEAGGRRPGRRVEFTTRDLTRLRASLGAARWVAAERSAWMSARTPRRTRASVVSAGSPELCQIQAQRVARGRYFDAADERARLRVAVLGADLAQIFFGPDDPLGREIQLDGTPFQVIGVLAHKGHQLVTMDEEHDRMIFVPLEVGLRAQRAGESVDGFYVWPRRLDDEAEVRAEVRAALWPAHHLQPEEQQAVVFMSIPEVAQPTRTIFFALQLLLGIVGTVTLLMAGVGVANLMIAIANERRMELAVRRTCGARRRDLVLQFLAESSVVVLCGGALGTLLGLGLVVALRALPLPPDLPRPLLLPSAVATTFAVLVGVGLGAGVWPARVAARVDPAAALRVT
jgi:putative ABC transport system permease protein